MKLISNDFLKPRHHSVKFFSKWYQLFSRAIFRTATPEQRQQKLNNLHANALSGNDIRSPSWQSQQERGLQSRHISGLSSEQRSAAREHLSEHRELRRR